jgi:hypothetical protein
MIATNPFNRDNFAGMKGLHIFALIPRPHVLILLTVPDGDRNLMALDN